ncbi:MAG: LysM domain-containing protein [Ilumatobacteraceae bacterium]
MRRRLGFVALVSLSSVAAGCGSDDGTAVLGTSASSTSSSLAIGTTSSVATSTTTATQQYTVAGGDALYVIADRFCTTADAIVAANGWADGIAHPLYPGDAITVPGPGCAGGPATVAPGDTANGEVDAAPDAEIHDPYFGDPGDYTDNYGIECDRAWDATWGLIKQGYSAEQVLPVLAALPADVPADVLAAVHAAAEFNAEWYPVYVAATDRAHAQYGYGYTEEYLNALSADPEYLAFFAAYLDIKATAWLPHEWSRSLCDDLFATDGSTP